MYTVQHELKPDVPIQKHVVSTLRCFERALQLDDASGKLWIEYGSCAYLIHSHSSRLLKQVRLHHLSLLLLFMAGCAKRDAFVGWLTFGYFLIRVCLRFHRIKQTADSLVCHLVNFLPTPLQCWHISVMSFMFSAWHENWTLCYNIMSSHWQRRKIPRNMPVMLLVANMEQMFTAHPLVFAIISLMKGL